MQQTDIEIYLRDCTLDALIDGLKALFGEASLELDLSASANRGLSGLIRHGELIAHVHDKLTAHVYAYLGVPSKSWLCLVFEIDPKAATSALPWPDDLACARALHQLLGCEVRCSADLWYEGASDEDWWWQLRDGGETRIQWPS